MYFALMLAAATGMSCSPKSDVADEEEGSKKTSSAPNSASAAEEKAQTPPALSDVPIEKTAAASQPKPPAPSPKPAPPAPITTASASSTDWPAFRGSSGMGISDATGLPVTWSQDENIAWKKELPGGGSSTPIVFGDRIYLTTYSGYAVPGQSGGSVDDLTRHLLCLNREDGATIWTKDFNAKLPEESNIRDHGYAANSVAVDSERVYTFLGKSGVFAHSHDGEQLWQADVGSKSHGWGTSASPVLYKNLVFINASVESGSLVALDRATGEEKWRATGIKEAWNTPVIVKTADGVDELVMSKHGKVLGFDPMSGDELWSCDTNITWYMVPSIVAADGIAYVLGGRSGVAGLAVRTGGRGNVTATHRLWTSNKGSNVTSPVYHDGHLYWMHEKLGIAYCAHAESGDLVYEERMNRAGQVYASSVLADGRVYHVTRSGKTFVVPAKPEFELLATNELRDGTLFNASPAISGKRLLIRSEKFLYCIEAQ